MRRNKWQFISSAALKSGARLGGRAAVPGRAPKREKREEVRDGGCASVSCGARVLQETLGEKTSTSASANTGWARVGGDEDGTSQRGSEIGVGFPTRPPSRSVVA